MITVRHARLLDIHRGLPMWEALMVEIAPKPKVISVAEKEAFLRRQWKNITGRTGGMLLADTEGGATIGLLCYELRPQSKAAAITYLYVAPEHRNGDVYRRIRRALEAMRPGVLAMGIEYVVVSSMYTPRNLARWRKLGFAPEVVHCRMAIRPKKEVPANV